MLEVLLLLLLLLFARVSGEHGALLRCDPLQHVYCPGVSLPSDGLRARHRAASPFPHTVIDHFLPPILLDAALQAVTEMEMDPQQFVREPQLGMHQQRKQRLKIGRQPLPTAVQAVLNIFANQAMARYLSNLTGIANLLPDPLLVGGGVQAVRPGGRLELHTDFTHHPVTGRKRAASALLFLNKGWRDDWGGALELWDAPAEPVSVNSTSGSRKNTGTGAGTASRAAAPGIGCRRAIQPAFNRLVVFTNGAAAVHGHPNRTACAPPTPTTCAKNGDSAMADAVADRAQVMDLPCTRRAFAFYFYTVDDWEHRRPRDDTPVARRKSQKTKSGPTAPAPTHLARQVRWRPELAPRRGGDGGGGGSETGRCAARVGTPLAPPWQVPATDGASNAFFFPRAKPFFPCAEAGQDSCQKCIQSAGGSTCAWCANGDVSHGKGSCIWDMHGACSGGPRAHIRSLSRCPPLPAQVAETGVVGVDPVLNGTAIVATPAEAVSAEPIEWI